MPIKDTYTKEEIIEILENLIDRRLNIMNDRKITKQDVIDRLNELIDANLKSDYLSNEDKFACIIQAEAFSHCIYLLEGME